MTEILTESFCERCGTRYTFESNARHRARLGRIRLLSRSFRHFVENDGSTISEALEAARGDLARAASAEQIDAFHRTFSFCLGCRQYVCHNCWNEQESKCLSCAPDLSREVLPAPFPDLALQPAPGMGAAATVGPPAEAIGLPLDIAEVPVEAATAEPVEEPVLPAAEVATAATEGTAPVPERAAEPVGEAPGTLTPDELTLVAGALAARSAAAQAVPIRRAAAADEAAAAGPPPDHAAAGREQTRLMLRRLRPPRPASAVIPTWAGPGAPAPGRGTAAAGVEPAPAPTPAVAGAPRRDDHVVQPTWQVVAPDAAPGPGSGIAPAGATSPGPAPAAAPSSRIVPLPGGTLRRPGRSIPERLPAAGAPPWATRLESARTDAPGIWTESSRDLLGGSESTAPAGVQACVSCGLPLSATARFCRRCGAGQT